MRRTDLYLQPAESVVRQSYLATLQIILSLNDRIIKLFAKGRDFQRFIVFTRCRSNDWL